MCISYFEICTDLPICICFKCLNNLHDRCTCGLADSITPNHSKDCGKAIFVKPNEV